MRIMETNVETKILPLNDTPSLIPVHPGEILGEELKERGISQKRFAESIGMQPSHLSALIHGIRSFTQAVAEKVASGLPGISASFWTKMQEQYNADLQRRKYRTSRSVTGYASLPEMPAAVLADPGVERNSRSIYSVLIPMDDAVLLRLLSAKLGWTILEEPR